MKVKTNELTGIALDWAVGQCEKRKLYLAKSKRLMTADYGTFNHRHGAPWYEPSSNWLQGGRIIERERLWIQPEIGKEGMGNAWYAVSMHDTDSYGPTPLIAAMRCYVANKLGEEVELPPDIAEAYAADLASREKYMAQRARWLKEWAMKETKNEEN